jgi:serine/threonine protein kinase
VHLARANGIQGFEKLVVVKRILPQLSADPHFVRMFLAEARLAALLSHPNVVQVYDLGLDQTDYYFTMEFVHGENLQSIVRAARQRPELLPIEYGVELVMGAAAGLHYAHERVGFDGNALGIVHRDVSPTNVMVTYDGCVKVADFGIAKAVTRTDMTVAGTRKGKVPYMSPEQCRAEPLDCRSDVFALGILLYECTTMTRLFDGDNEFGIMNRIVHGDIPPPSARRQNYPKELERIVMKALTVRRDQRYGSARALHLDLERLATDKRWRCTPVALGEWMHEVFRPRPFPWGALAAKGATLPPGAYAHPSEPGLSSPSASGVARVHDETPSSLANASVAAGSRSSSLIIVPSRPPNTLRGVAIGLGALAALAVAAVTGLFAYGAWSEASVGSSFGIQPAIGPAVGAAAAVARELPGGPDDAAEALAPPSPDPQDEALREEETIVVLDESLDEHEKPGTPRKSNRSFRSAKKSSQGPAAEAPGSTEQGVNLDAFMPQ